MKAFGRIGATALLVVFSGVVEAQNAFDRGDLGGGSSVATSRPLFDASASPSLVLPKTDIANVADKHDRRVRTIWIASILAMVAATSADAASSWQKNESNGLLASSNGTFGTKGIVIKASIAAAVLTPQIVFRKHREWHTAFAIGNFAEAAIFTGAAVHNMNVNTPAK